MKRPYVLIFFCLLLVLLLAGVFVYFRQSQGSSFRSFLPPSLRSQFQTTDSVNSSEASFDEKNPKFAVVRSRIDNNRTMYVIKGKVLGVPKVVDGFYSVEIAIDGDTKKTPVVLLLSKGDSAMNVGLQTSGKDEISWNQSTVAQLVPKLQANTSIEARVLVENTEKALADAWRPELEKLLKATEITEKTYAVQPRMIAIL